MSSKIDLISQLQQLENIPENNDRMMILFFELLQFYKSELNKIKDLKSESATEKGKLDNLYLALQNLNYEIDYLNREVQKYDSIDYSYQNLEMKPLEEFLRNYTHVDDHSTMIARLEDELQERKTLQKELETVRDERNKFNTALSTKKDELEQLNKDLEELIQFTLPIQERHGLTVTEDINLYQQAEKLSFPLYCLFKHLVGYDSVYPGMIKYEIVGALNESYKPNVSNFYDQHPVQLKLIFNSQISLLFKFLPILDIAVVETVVSVRNIHPDFQTSHLFPGDDGQTSPNPANEYLDDGNFAFSAEHATGNAYSWAQVLCGLNYPTNDQFGLSKNKNYVDNKPIISELNGLLLERKSKLDTISKVLEPLAQGKLQMKAKITGFHLSKTKYKCNLTINDHIFGVLISLPFTYPVDVCTFEIEISESVESNVDKDEHVIHHQITNLVQLLYDFTKK
ncbi:THO complex subunit 5 [Terramyces sp. JEL0728]|nr:THO complex subunit 5 [Terramyces sp. JEL0728]